MGNAIMSFYSALIDLLGRCAPEMHVCLFKTSTVEYLKKKITLQLPVTGISFPAHQQGER